MTSKEERRIKLAKQALTGNVVCRQCGGESITCQEIYMMQRFDAGVIYPGAPQLPVLPLTCDTCHTMTFLSAVKAGIVHPGTGKESDH